jgi:hypothetical protein
MPDFRRGTAAIEAAQEAAKQGGNFSPFAPMLTWKDKDEKYLLFLNDIESIALVDLHEWIPGGTGEKANGDTYTNWKFFISRKDPAIGEDEDELEDRLGNKPKARNIAAAVELEPIMAAGRGGRPRPKGWKVKTTEFQRKTDEGTETVTAPVVGIVRQSPINFFGYLSSFNDTEAPIEDTPFKVIRRGGDQNTQYDFTPYLDQEVDLSALVEYVDGITYVSNDEDGFDVLLGELEAAEDDRERGLIIGNALLEAHLNELADKDEYDEVVGKIDKLNNKYGSDKKSDSKSNSRPARQSQRSKAKANDDSDDAPAEDEAAAKSEKLDKFAQIRERAAQKKAKGSSKPEPAAA